MDILLNLFHKIQNFTRLIFYDFLLLSFSAFIVLQNFFFLIVGENMKLSRVLKEKCTCLGFVPCLGFVLSRVCTV